MTQTKAAARDGGDSVEGIDLVELPDARITIDLQRVEGGGWIAHDPDDSEGIVGHGETAPRAAEDYTRQVAEYLEGRADEGTRQ